jgi:hypothetical protein
MLFPLTGALAYCVNPQPGRTGLWSRKRGKPRVAWTEGVQDTMAEKGVKGERMDREKFPCGIRRFQ